MNDDLVMGMPVLSDSEPDRITQIENRLTEMQETLDFIRDTIVKADTTITRVAEEVMPTVTALMDTPIVKMLGMKKK